MCQIDESPESRSCVQKILWKRKSSIYLLMKEERRREASAQKNRHIEDMRCDDVERIRRKNERFQKLLECFFIFFGFVHKRYKG